ncbi:MAG: thioredoxin domain-containing protein [Deltaproteobacteria bacterium]|nr:thioredoxin domain-containing protein [Deltaproteobacteria bacterium]
MAAVLFGAVVGLVFAGVSTFDFVRHLDRDVHGVSCSFIPGLGRDATSSGCATAMMSAYSSVMRTTVWGGVPIALGAASVFAFLLFFAFELLLARRQHDPRATGFLALATALPALASAVMLYISLARLGTTCKLCVGIYAASALCVVGALGAWRRAARATRAEGAAPAQGASPVSFAYLAGAFAIGVVFVATPAAVYAAKAPDHARFLGSCDALVATEDPHGVMLPIGRAAPGAAPAIEVLDPLCPACKAFEQRLAGSGMADRLDRRLLMFPLDSTCNWMVNEPIHPGACTVSEAVLCAGDRAGEVIEWAFERQEDIRAASAKNPAAAATMVKARFPALAACIGSPKVQARLNQSLRWVVANGITVLTPQVFINGVRLCNEDLDLGLDYMLRAALAKYRSGALVPPNAGKPAASQEGPVAEKQGAKPALPTTTKEPSAAPTAKPTASAVVPVTAALPGEPAPSSEAQPKEPPKQKEPTEKEPPPKEAPPPAAASSAGGAQ